MLKFKKIHLSLIVLSILTPCFLICVIISFYASNKTSDAAFVNGETFGSYYTITNADSLRANYKNYTNFYIDSVAGLQAFGSSVYSQSSGLDYSFSGKVVTLKSNISCGGAVVRIGSNTDPTRRLTTNPVFAGTFNGNGFTISNFSLDSSNTTDSGVVVDESRGATLYARGLFLSVSGTIENLKLSSVKTSYDIYKSNFEQAALVGLLNGGTVRNCSVNGFTGGYYSSGIAAITYSAKIQNCYVEGVTVANEYALSRAYGIGPGRNTLTMTGTTKYLSCEIVNCVTKQLSISALTSTNCHSTAYSTTGLNYSPSGTSSHTWYYAADYNGGYPMLRIFLDKEVGWKTVSFSASGGSTPSSIKIPKNANETYSSSSSSIKIYDQTVSSTCSFCHYSSVTWTANSSTSYTVTFRRAIIAITIQEKNQILHSFTLNCGSSLNTTTIAYNGQTSKYKSCTIGSYTYTPPETHYISNVTMSNSSPLHEDTIVFITIEPKDYGLIII